jgi:hypothetical protein
MMDDLNEFTNLQPANREYLTAEPRQSGWEQALEVAGWVVVPFVFGVVKLYNNIPKLGLPGIIAISPDLASKLNLISKPQNSVLFRKHPFSESYIQASEYNPYLFREKIAELARVLIAAGASSFKVSADSTATTELVMQAGASMVAEGSIHATRQGATKIVWSFTGAGIRTGSLPEGLVWFNYEPEWQVIWYAAVSNGAASLAIDISIDSSHEFSADLASKFEKAGICLGGNFKDLGSSRVSIQVAFADSPPAGRAA